MMSHLKHVLSSLQDELQKHCVVCQHNVSLVEKGMVNLNKMKLPLYLIILFLNKIVITEDSTHYFLFCILYVSLTENATVVVLIKITDNSTLQEKRPGNNIFQMLRFYRMPKVKNVLNDKAKISYSYSVLIT